MSEGGVLTGPEITKEVRSGAISIDPFDFEQVNPASYDLRLGSTVRVYRDVVKFVDLPRSVFSPSNLVNPVHVDQPIYQTDDLTEWTINVGGRNISASGDEEIDVKKQPEAWQFEIDPKIGWLLRPGVGYLMHTVERVCTNRFIPVLDGKSSIGRLFVAAHVTAGYGDPGFDGQYTLEVIATHPVVVYPGMRFCQIRFHTAVGEILSYGKGGHYTGSNSIGPVPSRAWEQFKC